jgi:hypothetical protein
MMTARRAATSSAGAPALPPPARKATTQPTVTGAVSSFGSANVGILIHDKRINSINPMDTARFIFITCLSQKSFYHFIFSYLLGFVNMKNSNRCFCFCFFAKEIFFAL